MLRLFAILGLILVCAAQIGPLRTRIATDTKRVATGASIDLKCFVNGASVSDVYWTKNGVSVHSLPTSDRIYVTGPQLLVWRANKNDSGVYACHAQNENSSHFSTVRISVEDPYIPPTCQDNPYFADCHLIVKSKLCEHAYYSKFCCKTCVKAGELMPTELNVKNVAATYRTQSYNIYRRD